MKKKSWITYPLVVWSVLFIVVPVLLVIFFSFTEKVDDSYIFSLTHYKRLMNPVYFNVFFRSIWLALISTVICLLIGYPIAYILAKKPENKRNFFLLVFILPMWMNFLLRTYAWMSILGRNGIINSILTTIGLKPLDLLYSNGAVLLVMVYNFLPFMVLPIYTSLTKMDKDVINAAYDLGARSSQVFKRVIFPLSIPGVVSGITMVFMPAVSTFVISRLLGGGQYMLVGNLIEQQFTTVGDWNFGSAISIFMMILILISMAIMNKFTDEGDREGGGLL
ncbi:ABC transporter permease [Clostridium bornimense]|uniref:ABC transporter permease n=1 Tax=Clostridium bornimense TaxID=1216932 RepID=UPI001C127155|nr:ABC transporter permease [Clostridium bornimense]MBU5316656.1 ABC transporter permease [Clostridium bornimense]